MSTQPPLLAPENADDTAAAVLLGQYRDTVVEAVERTRDSGDEQAVVLYGRNRRRLSPTPFRSGTGTAVSAPENDDIERAATVIQIHSHPPPAPVAFSVQDLRVFVGDVLAEPARRGGPSAFAVVGQRGGEVRRGSAYIHSIEPADSYRSMSRREQRDVRKRVQATDSDPLNRAIQLDGDPNKVLAKLSGHVRYDRRRFSLPNDSR